MRYATRSLCVVALLLLSVCTYSDAVTDQEILEALGLITTGLETASMRQDEISTRLDSTAIAQQQISETLATVVEERLPTIDQRVQSQQSSFDAYVAREERDDALMLGALAVTLIVAILALIF